MLENWSQTNVWMSLSITLLTTFFYVQFSELDEAYIYLLTVFLGSNAVYHFHRLVRNGLIGELTFESRDVWLKQHKLKLWIWVVISGITSLSLFFYQNILFTKTTLILFISVVFYAIPFMRIKHKWIKLRDIPFFKVFLVAFIWAMVSVYLPLELTKTTWSVDIFFRFLANMILIFGITLPFDIRDIPIDESKTFANTLGEINTIRFSQIILLLWAIIEIYHLSDNIEVVLLTVFYSLYIINQTKISSLPRHFSIYLESIPIVYFVLFFLESNIKSYF